MTPAEQYRRNFAAIDWSAPLPALKRDRPRGPRSSMPCPMLIRDDQPALQSMLDGKFYESKSAMQRAYREGGVRIVEAGEKHEAERDQVTKDDIYQAVQMVRQGYKPEGEFIPEIDAE